LKNSNIIRRFTAAVFLLLFSFCITPKRFLHDLLANHRDLQTAKYQPVGQITASGFQCHIDELVVMTPFLPGMQINSPAPISSASGTFSELLSSAYFFFITHPDGRGPPAASFS
jgi:hypothetical protein